MSEAEQLLLNTAIFISDEVLREKAVYTELPPHLNLVRPLRVSNEQIEEFASALNYRLKRNIFEVAGLEIKTIQKEGIIQRVGGSALHHLHDETLAVADEFNIKHREKEWKLGTIRTWYTGDWVLPDRRTKVEQVFLAQAATPARKAAWQIIKTIDMISPNYESNAQRQPAKNIKKSA